eukprot:TRINITY_DN4959_c0_g1_i2.p1 TRINITY_DN4959_c0_g1~~TRINITY_DN4959_c0_g1_i2.p1  ORF type:complete len:298 (-),score=21.20 TRINITY_DN4959_c0_g1_i2:3-896(-)
MSFTTVGDDVIGVLYSYLDAKDICRAAQTCRSMYRASLKIGFVWQKLYNRDYGCSFVTFVRRDSNYDPRTMNWKAYYISEFTRSCYLTSDKIIQPYVERGIILAASFQTHINVVGDPGVGKTTIAKETFMKVSFSVACESSVSFSDDLRWTKAELKQQFSPSNGYIPPFRVFILTYSILNPASFTSIPKRFKSLMKLLDATNNKFPPFVLFGTHLDVKKQDLSCPSIVHREEARRLSKSLNIPFMEGIAKNERSIRTLARLCSLQALAFHQTQRSAIAVKDGEETIDTNPSAVCSVI